MKSVLQILLLWFVTLFLTFVLVIPNSSVYRDALLKFNKAVEEQQMTIPQLEAPYRHGFAIGYITAKYPLVLIKIFSIQTAFTLLIWVLLKRTRNSKPKNILLADPLDSAKNVLSNLFLFTVGVFNRRASEQLQFYFDMPVRSRFIGLLAYAIIFTAVTISYNAPSKGVESRFTVSMYLQVLYIIVLIALIFFYKPFRKNYQRRLFWLSLAGLAVVLSISIATGLQLARAQLNGIQTSVFDSPLVDTNKIIVNLLIVLAFSFYIEIMKQVSEQRASMQAEISMARRIQTKMLPVLDISNESVILFGQTKSANEVGGDYCDVVRLPDGRFAIAVGDVSGHNVAAGVMMSMLKVAFRTEHSYLREPAQLITSLNRTVYDHKSKNMFISFLTALIDPAEKTITLMNAGHLPLLHYSRQNNSVQAYRTGDIALGLKRDGEIINPATNVIRYFHH